MGEVDYKLYPKTSKDKGGIKFYFDYQGKHYTIRFAGNPILLLEAKFKQLGGVDFRNTYEAAKNKGHSPELSILKQAVISVEEFLTTLEVVDGMGRSPLVIYVKDFDSFKS